MDPETGTQPSASSTDSTAAADTSAPASGSPGGDYGGGGGDSLPARRDPAASRQMFNRSQEYFSNVAVGDEPATDAPPVDPVQRDAEVERVAARLEAERTGATPAVVPAAPAAAPAAPSAPAPVTPPAAGEATDDQALPFHTHPRWQEMLRQRNEATATAEALRAQLADAAKFAPVIQALRDQGYTDAQAYMAYEQEQADLAWLREREATVRGELETEFADAAPDPAVIDRLVAQQMTLDKQALVTQRATERQAAEAETAQRTAAQQQWDQHLATVHADLATDAQKDPVLARPISLGDGRGSITPAQIIASLYETARMNGDPTPWADFRSAFGKAFVALEKDAASKAVAAYVAGKDKTTAHLSVPVVTADGGAGTTETAGVGRVKRSLADVRGFTDLFGNSGGGGGNHR